MLQSRAINTQSQLRLGLLAGILAYSIWGFFPVYFKVTAAVSPLEILSHRIFWSVPFGLVIIATRRQFAELGRALRTPKTLGVLAVAAIALAVNWGVYIWAIQIDQIFQASLGYYITPLIYVIIGVVFFGEQLSRLQGLAAGLAAIGVTILAVYGGVFPLISLALACSFTLYGVIRKQVDIGAMPGLMIECIILFPPALLYLMWLGHSGGLVFGADMAGGEQLTALLVAAGPITVLPLLAFAIAARKLKLSVLGFLQYIAPTLQFGCGLYYGETFSLAHAICFACIWTALLIFTWDAWRRRAD
jgi:chloramphenicol-sensitive protein RarD